MAERRSRRKSSARRGSSSAEEERILGTAPSSPDIRKLELMEPSEEAKAHEPSDVDAMGKDKRREVIGHAYGPSRRSQVMFFVAVGAAIAVIVGGWTLAVGAFDQPPDSYPDKSPWSSADAQPIPVRDPAGPCGEPGNPFPVPADSPCAQGRSTEGEPPAPGSTQARQEEGAGGVVGGGAETEPGSN